MSVQTRNPPKPVARKASPINAEYEDNAKTLLRNAMTAQNMDYDDLAARLGDLGVKISGGGVANKISRGGFSASFMLQCMTALGLELVAK